MESSTKVNKKKKTVLLVDDEEMVLDIGVQMLQRLDYNVLRAAGGVEAIDIFKNNSTTIDVVILDIVMPDISGGETLDAIKRITPGAKIVVSSGFGKDAETSDIVQRCDGFIQKPFSLQQLSDTISAIIDHG